MPYQLVSGQTYPFRGRRRRIMPQGVDPVAAALMGGVNIFGDERDRSFQMEMLGQQLQNQLALQRQGQTGNMEAIRAQIAASEARDRQQFQHLADVLAANRAESESERAARWDELNARLTSTEGMTADALSENQRQADLRHSEVLGAQGLTREQVKQNAAQMAAMLRSSDQARALQLGQFVNTGLTDQSNKAQAAVEREFAKKQAEDIGGIVPGGPQSVRLRRAQETNNPIADAARSIFQSGSFSDKEFGAIVQEINRLGSLVSSPQAPVNQRAQALADIDALEEYLGSTGNLNPWNIVNYRKNSTEANLLRSELQQYSTPKIRSAINTAMARQSTGVDLEEAKIAATAPFSEAKAANQDATLRAAFANGGPYEQMIARTLGVPTTELGYPSRKILENTVKEVQSRNSEVFQPVGTKPVTAEEVGEDAARKNLMRWDIQKASGNMWNMGE